MSINIPTYLLKHSKQLKLAIDLTTFTDRQLNNIVKQVSTGAISDGDSATSRLAREIARRYDTPHVRISDWSIGYHDLEPDHPLFEAGMQACAVAKLESVMGSWYKRNIDEALTRLTTRGPSGAIPISFMSTECKNIVKAAAKVKVPDDHNVHPILAKILSREINTIELDLT